MHWTIHLEGGPRRVNHAAVAIGNQIFSFGGYCSGEVQCRNEPIDVHVLNTATYRWQRVPSNAERQAETQTQPKPACIPTINVHHEGPSTEDLPVVGRRRARSVAELHPLGQLRYIRPALPERAHFEPEDESSEASSSGGASSRFSSLLDENDAIDSEEVETMEVDTDDDLDTDLDFSGGEEDEEGSSDYDDPLPRAAVLPRRHHRMHQQDAYDFLLALQQQHAQPADLAAPAPSTDHKESQVPYQRYGHTVVNYNNKAYLWGGRNDEFGSSHLLHEYDPATNEWNVVSVANGLTPPARDGHTAVMHKDKMYIFGGFEEHNHRFSQETYAFDFISKTWQQINTDGEPPQHRDFHTACVLNGKMYVFGGRSDEMGQFHSSQDKYCDQLFALDLSTHSWAQLKSQGQAPCGRRSHSVWTYNGRMYLFGGYQSTDDVHFNDLYEFNPDKNEWKMLNPTGRMAPSPRRRQCTILFRDRVFLFGGTMPRVKNGSNGLIDLSDLYVLDFHPSLATLCSEAIIRNGLQQHCEQHLPHSLRRELHNMSTANTISKTASVVRVECTNG